MLVKHCREQGTPRTNTKFDVELKTKIDASAEGNLEASKWEDSGSKEVQRQLTRDEVRKCVAKRKSKG